MSYMIHVCNTMWRFKNQPSNSTSCSDNALHLLILVAGRLYWGLQLTSSFPIWGCILKGCFERYIFWRAKSRLKGIEDFNLEHCPKVGFINKACFSLQVSWILPLMFTVVWETNLQAMVQSWVLIEGPLKDIVDAKFLGFGPQCKLTL